MAFSIVLLLIPVIFLVYKVFTCGSEVPSHLPWVGQDVKGPFKRSRSYLRSVFGTRAMIEEGYQKYSKSNLPFVLPNLFTGAEILLPPSRIDWVHDQEESNFSALDAHAQFMRAEWTLLNPLMSEEHVFEAAIKKNLTRHLDTYLSTMAQEAEAAVDGQAGYDAENWKEVDGFRFWKRMMIQVVSSIYVGPSLCRNETYLYYASRFNQMVIFNSGLIGALPSLLRPLIGPFIMIPDKLRHRGVSKMAKPLIEERLRQAQQVVREQKGEKSLPNDLITWACLDAARSVDTKPEKSTSHFLAERLSVMNFVSIDSTTISLTNVLFDILHSSKAETDTSKIDLMQQVQAEVDSAYKRYCETAEHDRSAGKTFLESLPILDACLKESFRLRNFISRGLVRTTTSTGTEVDVPGVGPVPKGVKIGIPIWGIHHEDKVYGDASTWRADRWLDNGGPMQNAPISGGGESHMVRGYMPFGFKRHACPGRFYAVRLVKILLVYILLSYDIKLGSEELPKHYWWGISVSPPMEASLLLRRRRPARSASAEGWWKSE